MLDLEYQHQTYLDWPIWFDVDSILAQHVTKLQSLKLTTTEILSNRLIPLAQELAQAALNEGASNLKLDF